MDENSALPLFASLLMATFGVLFLMREKVYMWLYGAPDLGPITLDTLKRSAKPNDALAATGDLNLNVKVDIELPVFHVSPDTLRSAVMKAASMETLQEPADHSEDANAGVTEDRFVQRTPAMHYPDTINALTIALPDAADGTPRSALVLLSRSQVGYSDLSVNRMRLDRWLTNIHDALPANATPN